jgi:hypothetical protein
MTAVGIVALVVLAVIAVTDGVLELISSVVDHSPCGTR